MTGVVEKQIWYAKNGSDPDLVKKAILIARVNGSIGATEETTKPFVAPFSHSEFLASQEIERFAIVRKEGYQEYDYYKVEEII